MIASCFTSRCHAAGILQCTSHHERASADLVMGSCQSFPQQQSALRKAHLCLTRSLTLPAAAANMACTGCATSCRKLPVAGQLWPVSQTGVSVLCAHGSPMTKRLAVCMCSQWHGQLQEWQSQSRVAACTWPGACANRRRPSCVRLWPDTRSLVAAGSRDAAAVLTAAVIMIISEQKKAAMLNSV